MYPPTRQPFDSPARMFNDGVVFPLADRPELGPGPINGMNKRWRTQCASGSNSAEQEGASRGAAIEDDAVDTRARLGGPAAAASNRTATSNGSAVEPGNVRVEPTCSFGPEAQQLPQRFFGSMRASSTDEPIATLRQRLAHDGYLLVRGLHDKSAVKAAAGSLLARLAAKGLVLDDAHHPLSHGVHSGRATSAGSREHLDMHDDAHFCRVFEPGSKAQVFMSDLLNGDAKPFAFKFLRCVPPGGGPGPPFTVTTCT